MLAAADTRRRPVLGVVAAVSVALLTVSGCAAGQDAQTVEQTSVVDGTGFQAGQVDLRDVGLRAPGGPSYAAGANVYLEGLMVNKAAADDTLVSVSTPAATSVAFYPDGVTAVLGTAETPSSPPTQSASPTDTGTPTDGGTPTTSGSAGAASSAAAPSPLTDIPLPTNRSVQFGYDNQQVAIVLLGLTKPLFPSQSVPITFTFANGGSVTATISVKLPVDSTLDAPTVNTEESEGGE